MKKIVYVLSVFVFFIMFVSSVSAEEIKESPRLIVTEYTVESGIVNAGETGKISITVENKSGTAAKNVTLKFGGGNIGISGIDTVFIGDMKGNGKFVWEREIFAAEGAAGEETGQVTLSYEDESGQSFSDLFQLTVKVKPKEIKEAKPDYTRPKLKLLSYSLPGDFLTPGEEKTVTLKVKNTSAAKTARNIFVVLSDPAGDILAEDFGKMQIAHVSAGAETEIQMVLTAKATAPEGGKELVLQLEYEDYEGNTFSESEGIPLEIRQKTELDFELGYLPAALSQGESAGLTVKLMNTGKGNIVNAKALVEMEGVITGGTAFGGEINLGESRELNINLRAGDTLGEKTGLVKISYEDIFGNEYEKTAEIKLEITEKINFSEEPEAGETKKNPLWWAFLLGGLIGGAASGAAVPMGVYSARQRKEDEQRL